MTPPLFRSVETDWLGRQKDYLNQVAFLQEMYRCPVLIAGDIFDDGWRPHRCPPELINFAIKYLPNDCYAVPGQHDLPHHRIEDIKRSAYWTLVEAGKIKNIPHEMPLEVGTLRLWGFPWGAELFPFKGKTGLLREIAVVHRYLWTKNTGYPNAPEQNRLKNVWGNLRGYDFSIFGDNHTSFIAKPHFADKRNGLVVNCGCFSRRKRDEMNYDPSMWLLKEGGEVERVKLNVSKDQYLTDGSNVEKMIAGIGLDTFLESLSELGQSAVDFNDAITRTLERENVPESVKRIILTAIGGK